MGDNKKHENKATRKIISLDTKMQVLRRLDTGERQFQIGAELNLSTSTIRTILKNKEKIMLSATTNTTASTRVSRSRNHMMEEMEKRLSIWIDDEIERNMPLSQSIIMEKAKRIFRHIQGETGNTTERFVASRGWFYKFKHRNNYHNIENTGEAARGGAKTATDFQAMLKTIIERGNYPPELVFNVDETGLFWKKMPERTFLNCEEKRAHRSIKAAKDRLSLLLGGNANGDFKLKPLVVYHSKNPRSMKGISTATLPVIWESNKKQWITMNIFQNWFVEHFCPTIKRYCERKNLEPRVLLLMNKAPSHPTNLSSLETGISVEVVFLPPNTASLLQPMDQGVISNFKAYYLRRTFTQMFEKTDGQEKQSIRDFWKNYNILDAVGNINIAWNEITEKCLKGAWKKIWPDLDKDDTIQETVDTNEIEQDIDEISEESSDSFSTDELQEFGHQEEHENIESSSSEEEQNELSTGFLKYSLDTITQIMDQFIENDTDFDRSGKARRGVMDALSTYRQILTQRKRKKKISLAPFWVKKQKITNAEESE